MLKIFPCNAQYFFSMKPVISVTSDADLKYQVIISVVAICMTQSYLLCVKCVLVFDFPFSVTLTVVYSDSNCQILKAIIKCIF